MKLKFLQILNILMMCFGFPSVALSQSFYSTSSINASDVNIYIASSVTASDVNVYIASSISVADVVFYPARCGIESSDVAVYLASSIMASDINVYIASLVSISDVGIYFTRNRSIADHALCFPHGVSQEEVHELGVAAAAYLYENDLIN